MNIDAIVKWVICPLVRYPLIVFVVFRIGSQWLLLLIVYSAFLEVFLRLNHWYKCRGEFKWKRLGELSDPKAIITGGSGGLGLSIVTELLSRFPNVKILNVDMHHSPKPDNRIVDYICDLRNSKEVENVLNEIKAEYGDKIHLIINNAGMRSRYVNLKNLKEHDMQEVFAVNALAPVRIIQELTPEESSQRQCYVVNIASTLGILAPAKVASYAASKAALIAFHNSYSFELESKAVSNIRTLLVLPGQLDTEMFGGFEPPHQFFAPLVGKKKLAKKVIDCSSVGQRGNIYAPFYSNFAHILMSLPYAVGSLVRKISKMDDCLPDD